jgi:hypothetical protein
LHFHASLNTGSFLNSRPAEEPRLIEGLPLSGKNPKGNSARTCRRDEKAQGDARCNSTVEGLGIEAVEFVFSRAAGETHKTVKYGNRARVEIDIWLEPKK